MSWVVLLCFSLLVFFLFVFLFRKFVGYMKKEQNLQIESFKDMMIDKDNPVGLYGEELEKLKEQQKEAQRHLNEVISKIPVIQKDGRFQIDEEAIRQRRAAALENEARNGAANKDTV
ncbi:MAG: hypothetical protein LAC69_09715 [Chlorobium sp.]|jgi:hypothetical protein|nr:hypothetical protein [Chlorobium sp.]